jgi:hypothetical protein
MYTGARVYHVSECRVLVAVALRPKSSHYITTDYKEIPSANSGLTVTTEPGKVSKVSKSDS